MEEEEEEDEDTFAPSPQTRKVIIFHLAQRGERLRSKLVPKKLPKA